MPTCHACGAEIPLRERIGRRDTCERCRADLHCCRNCRFFAPGMHNDCAESQAERVVDKVRSNFCDYFTLRPDVRGEPADARVAARAQLDQLFKKKAR